MLINMKKHFYSHLVRLDSIHIALNDLELTVEERDELVGFMDSSIHHIVLDTILSELSEYDKKLFLTHLHSQKHDEIWELLHEKSKDIETKIKNAVDDLKKQLHEDIYEAKKKK